MQICFSSNLFTINNEVQETWVRFTVFPKKVCLELGREYFSISFSPASSLCGNQYSQSTVKEKLLPKKECPLPSFSSFFISGGKSPLNELKKKNQMYPGNMPFRILEWELQTKLVKESNA